MKILVAVDSFKGTLTSHEIAKIIKKHYKNKYTVIEMPISDGGEGFLESIRSRFNLPLIWVETIGPLGAKIVAPYVINDSVAYIETSNVSGINLISKEKLNALETTTYGLGALIKDAINRGVKKIVLGLGGSATNDAGTGLLQSLGAIFYNEDNIIEEYMSGCQLNKVTNINLDILIETIKDIEFEIASDVTNVLLGAQGTANVYARQKGASDQDIELLENNMTSFSILVEKQFGKNYVNNIGSGSAGGLGYGAMTFLNAKFYSGIDYIINLLSLEKVIKDVDLVFVGEGKVDLQTKFGKAPHGISQLAKKHNKKVIGIFAISEKNINLETIDISYTIVPKYATLEQSMKKPKESLIKLLEDIKL